MTATSAFDGDWCVERKGVQQIAALQQARRDAQRELTHELSLPITSVRWLESEADLVLTTMRRCVAARHGRLEVVATFDDVVVPIERFADLDRSPEMVEAWFRLDQS